MDGVDGRKYSYFPGNCNNRAGELLTMTVGVYGLGRFGSFWAEILARSIPVCAYSRSPERTTPPGVRRVGEDEVLAQPVIFLCVAISAVEDVLVRSSRRLAR